MSADCGRFVEPETTLNTSDTEGSDEDWQNDEEAPPNLLQAAATSISHCPLLSSEFSLEPWRLEGRHCTAEWG